MESLVTILTSANAPFILGFLTIVLIFIFIAIKNKWFSFKGKGITIGVAEQTRQLIQNQFEYTKSVMDASISYLPKHLDEYRAKYVIARAEDIIQRAIIFNNMSKDESYIKAKQALVYQAVIKRTEDDYFKTPEFKEYCDNLVKDLIYTLVDMKKQTELA